VGKDNSSSHIEKKGVLKDGLSCILTMSLTAKQPIGVFDSGIGGLIALRRLADLLPHEDLIYLGDMARVPYGNRSSQTITQYSQELVNFLLGHSVKQILVACNTVSAVSLPMIQKMSPILFVDVIKPAVTVVLRAGYQRIGIIGTRATIQSKAYEIEIQRQSQGEESIAVYSQECPLFVPLIEEGWEKHPAVQAIVETYLLPLKAANIQALVLGCTHYSFLRQIIQNLLPDVHLIDSGAEAAAALAKQSLAESEKPSLCLLPRKIDCYLTDLIGAHLERAQEFLGLPVTFYKAIL